MNYYNEVKNELIKYEIYNKVKEYNCKVNRITTFFKVGKILRQAEIVYGKSVIKNIANYHSMFIKNLITILCIA